MAMDDDSGDRRMTDAYFYCRKCGGYTKYDENSNRIEDTCECFCITQDQIDHILSCTTCYEKMRVIR